MDSGIYMYQLAILTPWWTFKRFRYNTNVSKRETITKFSFS